MRAAVAAAIAAGAVLTVIAAPAHATTTPDAKPRNATLTTGMSDGAVTELQIRLNDAGIIGPITGDYTARTARNVRRFQWKFNIAQTGDANKKTLRKLRRLTRHGDGVPRTCKTRGRAVCVDKTLKIVRYYRHGTLKRSVDARFGRKGARTREANWRITRKRKNDYSTLFNSPMPWSSYFSGGQSLHYSKYFAAVGYNGASHGCINIGRKKDARWLYKRMPVGSFFKVYR